MTMFPFRGRCPHCGFDHSTQPPFPTQQPAARAEPAMNVYEEITSDGEPDSPEEKLRLFCSVAMRGQDWIDAEKFFDALKPVPPSADAKDAARYRIAQAAGLIKTSPNATTSWASKTLCDEAIDAMQKGGAA